MLAFAAKVMASTAVAALGDEALLNRAKAEHREFRAKNPFANPITDDMAPPLDMAAH
jgi:aminobenzoyl-glutamate utilization protein B